jgi:dUTP pyrophosphatase
MGVLASQQIESLISGVPPLVTGLVNLNDQIQPNGLDLTIESVAKITSSGKIGLSNDDRVLATTDDMEFDAAGLVHLPRGVYIARLNETLSFPKDLMGIAKPRSSLLRNGVAVHNAVWDAGYIGRSQVQIVVYNDLGFTVSRNARIVQMVFMTLDSASETPYAGLYQGEATPNSVQELT